MATYPGYYLSLLSLHALCAVASTYNSLSVKNITTIVPPFPYPFPDGYAATAFSNAATLRDALSTKPKTTTISGTYNISIRYCTPTASSPKSSTLQLLSHVIGFNKSYWDFRLPGRLMITNIPTLTPQQSKATARSATTVLESVSPLSQIPTLKYKHPSSLRC